MNASQQPQTSRTATIALFMIAGALLLGVGMFGGNRDRRAAEETAPAFRILTPADGDVVTNPVTVTFSTPARLRLTREGWTAGELHLHLMVDERELMPAAADITADDSAFTWRVPDLEPGTYRMHLTWAGRHHRNIAGDTDTVTIHVRTR